MTRYLAVLSYIGTDFRGWQIQKNADRTVQGVFEEALARFSGEEPRASAAGRTDAGVHAEGQVVHFDLERRRDPDRVRDGVNAHLPADVRVLSVAEAASGFDARRDAAWKEYLYRWSRARVVPPKEASFVAPISSRSDAVKMRRSAEFLPGRRDFGVFGVRLPANEPTVRVLHFVRIEEAGDEIRALFRGEAFLRGMVRSICGVLADSARGRVPADRVRRLLETGDRSLLSAKAPACGLTLLRVHYEGLGLN
ncbi:MAG TPA: tRNA pseudouridine(38-40) synthase TruA [Thermoanaerobaculia bacterium]|nr:tRNA pseudouridine(38-40) synthase TruA [Thermoanaerobaculia bacterium]